jgi:hypothetical protein
MSLRLRRHLLPGRGLRTDFDPDHDWQNGDVIPRRLLREPAGSRGDITVDGKGRWADGYWDVTLVVHMDTGSPLDDKIFHEQGATTSASPCIAMPPAAAGTTSPCPYSLGLGREAELQAATL